MTWTETDGPNGRRPDRCPVCATGVGVRAAGAAAEAACPACGHLLWFVSDRVDGVTVVRLLDTRAAVVELLDMLDNAVADARLDRLLIHFGAFQQVSSAALGKLVKLRGRAESLRGKLKLSGLHADLRQVFKITRLDTVFEVYATEAEALESFAAERVAAAPA